MPQLSELTEIRNWAAASRLAGQRSTANDQRSTENEIINMSIINKSMFKWGREREENTAEGFFPLLWVKDKNGLIPGAGCAYRLAGLAAHRCTKRTAVAAVGSGAPP
jgi:hypothetical protein